MSSGYYAEPRVGESITVSKKIEINWLKQKINQNECEHLVPVDHHEREILCQLASEIVGLICIVGLLCLCLVSVHKIYMVSDCSNQKIVTLIIKLQKLCSILTGDTLAILNLLFLKFAILQGRSWCGDPVVG